MYFYKNSDIDVKLLILLFLIRYGFSEKLGKFAINREEPLSGEIKNLIEQEVSSLLNNAYERA